MFHCDENRIKRHPPLASGGFGTVYEYRPKNSDGKQSAVKEVTCKEPAQLEKYVQEIVLSFNHNSPFILPSKGFNIVQYQPEKWMVRIKMPRMKRSLRDYITHKSNKPFTIAEIVKILYRLAYGLKQLQNVNISHRDMKPDNILLDNDSNVWIADFGLGRLVRDDTEISQTTLAGTPSYFPPETSGRKKIKKKDLYKIDLWNLGVTMYEVCLFNDFYLHTELHNKTLEQELQIVFSKVAKRYGAKFSQILAGLLCIDPEKRISFDTVCQLLEDNFSEHLQSTFDAIADNIRKSHRKIILDRFRGPNFTFHFDEEITVKPKDSLHLNSSVIEDLNNRLLQTLNHPPPELLQMDFSWCKSLDDNSLQALNLKNLTKSSIRELKLDFTGCSKITDNGLSFINQNNLEVFKKLDSLMLDFSESNVTQEGLKHVLENIKGLPLKKLSIRAIGSNKIKIQPDEAQRFAEKIKQLASLETLKLDIEDLMKSSKKTLRECLTYIKNLEII